MSELAFKLPREPVALPPNAIGCRVRHSCHASCGALVPPAGGDAWTMQPGLAEPALRVGSLSEV
jgi:hypothetical protein